MRQSLILERVLISNVILHEFNSYQICKNNLNLMTAVIDQMTGRNNTYCSQRLHIRIDIIVVSANHLHTMIRLPCLNISSNVLQICRFF